MFGILFYALGALLARLLPHRISRAVAVRLADVRFALDARNRKAVESNVRQVLGPRAGEAQVRRLARRIFRNFAYLVLDFLRLPQLARHDLTREVRVMGWRYLEAARARGHGVVLLVAHVGSWELGGVVLSKLGVPVVAVARDHGHPRVTRFFNRRREDQGIRMVGLKGTARETVQVLRHNGVVALFGDRDFVRSRFAVRFFGRPARLPRSHVTLAMRTGAAILPAVAVRRGRGPLCLVFERPILVRRSSGVHGIETGARRCAAALERHIRRHLDQWFAFEPVWEDGSQAAAGL